MNHFCFQDLVRYFAPAIWLDVCFAVKLYCKSRLDFVIYIVFWLFSKKNVISWTNRQFNRHIFVIIILSQVINNKNIFTSTTFCSSGNQCQKFQRNSDAVINSRETRNNTTHLIAVCRGPNLSGAVAASH